MYGRKASATLYGTWKMRQEVWDTVKLNEKERMDKPVFRDSLETVYVLYPALFKRGVKTDRRPKGLPRFCMLSCFYCTVPFQAWSKV